MYLLGSIFSYVLYEINNFCDLLYRFLYTPLPILRRAVHWKEEICSSFRVDPFSEGSSFDSVVSLKSVSIPLKVFFFFFFFFQIVLTILVILSIFRYVQLYSYTKKRFSANPCSWIILLFAYSSFFIGVKSFSDDSLQFWMTLNYTPSGILWYWAAFRWIFFPVDHANTSYFTIQTWSSLYNIWPVHIKGNWNTVKGSNSVKFIFFPSEKCSTLKEKNLLPRRENSFLLELTPFQKELSTWIRRHKNVSFIKNTRKKLGVSGPLK